MTGATILHIGYLHQLSPEDQTLLQQELTYQSTHPLNNIPRGIIHADLFCDNALFDGENLTGIIDFYYACNDVYIYDLAITVNAWCTREDGLLDSQRYTALMQSYQQQRALSDDEIKQWLTALRLAALRFWLSRLNDKFFPRDGYLTHTKNPDHLKMILQGHIQHKPGDAKT